MRIKVSKLDAARCQILTAIRLYFENGDIVSIHTLAAAAFKITQNLCDNSPELSDSLTDWVDGIIIKPEYKKLFWTKFHETANYFKHAERDSDDIHDFNPEKTEHMLFLAIHQYRILTGEWPPEIRLFASWYVIFHPEPFNPPPGITNLVQDYSVNDRNKFWRDLLPLMQDEQELKK